MRSGGRSAAEAVTLRKSWWPHAVVPGSVASSVMDVTVLAGPALRRAQCGTPWGARHRRPRLLGLSFPPAPMLQAERVSGLSPASPFRPRLPSHLAFIKAEIPVRNTLFLKGAARVCFLTRPRLDHTKALGGGAASGGAEHLSPSCSAPISLGLSLVLVAPGFLSALP